LASWHNRKPEASRKPANWLFIRQQNQEKKYPPEKNMSQLKTLFNSSCVAVVGASQNSAKLGSHVMKILTRGGCNKSWG